MLSQLSCALPKRVGLSLLFAVLLAACGSVGTGTAPVPSTASGANSSVSRATAKPAPTAPAAAGGAGATNNGRAITDQASLIGALKAAGATVESGETIEQPYLTRSGTSIQVNGQDVQVYQYADAASANTDAKNMADAIDGTGTTMVTWVASPHAYQYGRVLALYVGDEAATLQLLEATMGAPFATKQIQAIPTSATTSAQTSGEAQMVVWQNLSITLPPNAVWQPSSGANAAINGAPVLERGAVTYPNIAGAEQPYGPTFLVLQFSGTVNEWLDLERKNDASAGGNPLDEATVRDQTIAGRPAKAYRRSVTGTALTEFYVLRLDDTRLLWITTDDAQNPLYQSVIDSLRLQTQ